MKSNAKLIAFIIEIALLFGIVIFCSIYFPRRDDIPMWPFIVASFILMFAMLYTLYSMRRDAIREMRDDEIFNDEEKVQNRAFLPWLQDKTTTIIHDLEDEDKHHNQQ